MKKIFYIFLLFTVAAHAEDKLSNLYFSEIEKWQQNGQKYADFGNLLIFVSFSMPQESLHQLLIEAHKMGGNLILRGLVNNSFKDTVQAVYHLVQNDNQGGMGIDPTLFKKFNITQVPAFVMVDHNDLSQPLCTKYDVVYGNVTLEYALRKIAKGGMEHELAQQMLQANS